ncbi:uncharacterized protein RAG0_04266 [Rhynchosporium agropyri]|uniref:Uncharacterized protein n=1 Tax=Rhynchosporium agropyri TaxID=914238 RepID=A0A1E1K808_9HELO|nr:uncharacterized protein RAG0_04266 [Rhynchosporium agropyri]
MGVRGIFLDDIFDRPSGLDVVEFVTIHVQVLLPVIGKSPSIVQHEHLNNSPVFQQI